METKKILKISVIALIASYLLLALGVYAHGTHRRSQIARDMQTHLFRFYSFEYRELYKQWYDDLAEHMNTVFFSEWPLIRDNIYRNPALAISRCMWCVNDPVNIAIFSLSSEVIYDVKGVRDGERYEPIRIPRVDRVFGVGPNVLYYFDGVTPLTIYYDILAYNLPRIFPFFTYPCEDYVVDLESSADFRTMFVRYGDINSTVIKRNYDFLFIDMARAEAERLLGGHGKLLNYFEVEGRTHNVGTITYQGPDGTFITRTNYVEVPGGRFETVGYRSECTVILVTYKLLEDGDWILAGAEYFNLAYFIRVGTVPPHR